MDLSKHPQTLRVLQTINDLTSEETQQHMKISSLSMRQNATAKLCVENVDCLCMTKLCTKLPKNSEVFMRSALNSKQHETVSSRLEIYYKVTDVDYLFITVLISTLLMLVAFFTHKYWTHNSLF